MKITLEINKRYGILGRGIADGTFHFFVYMLYLFDKYVLFLGNGHISWTVSA